MSKLIALMTNDNSLSALAIAEASAALSSDVGAQTGLGLGWLQEGRTLLRKYPAQSASEIELTQALSSLITRAALGFVNHEGSDEPGLEHLSPFRYQSWLYAQRGAQPLDEAQQLQWRERLPDFLERNIQSESASEANLFALLNSLHAHDVYHSPTHQSARRAAATAKMIQQLEALRQAPLDDFALMAMTDRYVLAAQGHAGLYWRMWHGIEEPAPEPLYAGQHTRPRQHPHFKALLIVSSEIPLEGAWQAVPARHVLWMGADFEPGLIPIDA